MTQKLFRIALLGAAALLAADKAVDAAKQKAKEGKYDEAIATLEKADAKSPEVRRALAETHLAYADSFFYNNSLPPRQKYRPALKEYRKVLEYDKDNKKAKENAGMIESIYKQMGMPVPQ